MISDEPDEDADLLDDEAALDTYLEEGSPKPDNRAAGTIALPDWPSRAMQEVALNIDPETLCWFKATSADWRREIRSVLRGWVAAHTAQQQPTLRLNGPASDADQPEDPA